MDIIYRMNIVFLLGLRFSSVIKSGSPGNTQKGDGISQAYTDLLILQ